jgi:glycosyltransferase involved in cell wall biosynthesis
VPPPKFIVIQRGARRAYAVPLILHQAGMLERLFTDLTGNVGLGRWLSLGHRLPVVGPALRRLAGRKLPEELIPLTCTLDADTLQDMLHTALDPADPDQRFIRAIQRSTRWGRSAVRRGFGDATHLFTMLGEGGPAVVEARRRGLKVVAEVYILLSTERILQQERALFPDWEPYQPDYSQLRATHDRLQVLRDHVDFYLCPSAAVQADLIQLWQIPPERTALVPYGLHPRWLELKPQPQPGRILFVGTADLRKGIHYLAMAAEELQRRGRRYEIRVAGHVTDSVRQQALCRHLTFLGRVPREHIHEEFQKADVFTLPSLAEGSAEVTYEALGAGLPLVVTAAAGSVARHGKEGLIIPERDPIALADALEHLVEDRNLRSQMAQAARVRAADYTWEAYGRRLMEALKDQMK